MNERLVGKVTRWGARGYGFIRCAGLERDAWFHLRFVEDAWYRPSEGDVVSFSPVRFSDGRVQARAVRRVAAEPRVSESVTGDARLTTPLLTPEARDRLLTAVEARLPAAISPAQPSDSGLAGRIEAARRAREAEGEREEESAARLEREAVEAEQRREELAREIEAAGRAAEEARRSAAEARARATRIREGEPGEGSALAVNYAREAAAGLVEAIAGRRRESERFDAARRAAVARIGEEAISRYEQARARLRSAADPLEREAFAEYERGRRAAVGEYARALDVAEGRQDLRVPVVAFAPLGEEPGGPATLVLAVVLSGLEQDPHWRLACAFWQGIAEACRGAIGHGVFAGLVAARVEDFDPAREGMELLSFALDEACGSRPALAKWGFCFALESAPLPAPGFESLEEEPDVLPRAAELPPASGGTLLEVALRLGLPLRDAFEALHGLGLGDRDDALDAGVEETLRRLFGAPVESPRPAGDIAETPDAPPPRVAPPTIRERLLAKLLRDRRIGGRHTAVENVYGHHFADHEKEEAKEEIERLVHAGLLLAKRNEGQRHVSVNPRRLGEARRIVENGPPAPS